MRHTILATVGALWLACATTQRPAPAPPAPAPAPARDVKPLLAEAQTAIARDQWTKAARIYREAAETDPTSVEARTGLGIALVLAESSYEEAIPLLKEAVAADGTNANAWLALGLALDHLGRAQEAKAPLQTYLRLKPTGSRANDVRAMLKLAR